MIVELKFVNVDASPKTTALMVDEEAIAPIMDWYGAFYAGDRYAVYRDGERLNKGLNGELRQ